MQRKANEKKKKTLWKAKKKKERKTLTTKFLFFIELLALEKMQKKSFSVTKTLHTKIRKKHFPFFFLDILQ